MPTKFLIFSLHLSPADSAKDGEHCWSPRSVFSLFAFRQISERLKGFGISDPVVVDGNDKSVDLSAPNTVSIITYGMVGTNRYEEFDCVFCLSGYYVNEQVVNDILQDVVGTDGYIPIEIRTEGSPRRRHAGVRYPSDHRYDIAGLAQLALEPRCRSLAMSPI